MSHIFTLDDLARRKVCLEFVNQKEPPSIHWRPHSRPLSINTAARGLSVRVNESFVNGRPSLTLYLVEDPDFADDSAPSDISTQVPSIPVSAFSAMNETLQCQLGTEPQDLKPQFPEAPGALTPPDVNNDSIQKFDPVNPRVKVLSLTDDLLSNSGLTIYPSPSTASTSSFDFTKQSPVFYPALSPTFHGDPWQIDPLMSKSHDQIYIESHTSPSSTISPLQCSPLQKDSANSILSPSMTFDLFLGAATAPPRTEHDWGTDDSCHLNINSAPTPTQDRVDDQWSNDSPLSDSNNATASLPSTVQLPEVQSPERQLEGPKRGSRGNRPVKCSHAGCNRTFSNAYTCGVHARVHGPNKKKRVKCSLCDETFSRRHDMMRHEASQHGKVQEWTCQLCRRFFSSQAMLTDHKCPALR